ncbi:NADH-quinone oxidoreductase subunit C [bacterium]|nr:NADH-quinone oxidoreductase subunit C [bacterium]
MKLLKTLKATLKNYIKDVKVHNERRIYITIDSKFLKECVNILFRQLNGRYIIISGVDNFDSFELIYHFGFDLFGAIVSLRVFLERNNPEVVSLVDTIPGVFYIEREIWELLGINFVGHPNLKHFLLRDDWPKEDYPLRKNSNNITGDK